MTYFKSIFKNKLKFNTRLGIAMILLIGIPRFIIVLQANATGNYSYTSMIFVFMMLIPLLLLNKNGRRFIGINKTDKIMALVYSFSLGIIMCLLVFLMGILLYGHTDSNWFVYISNSYRTNLPDDLTGVRFIYFAIFGSISMFFSPIGEELMYRGFIHQCFEQRFGSQGASRIDSAAFAITHLAHFGILYTITGWIIKPIPAIIWILAMYFVSRVFFFCRKKSASILGAIIAHAGFNLAMTYFIFYFIL
ncbi:MAG: CPBP family intramembrane glutamic endopeptidase [Flavobacteriaceae bacterium]